MEDERSVSNPWDRMTFDHFPRPFREEFVLDPEHSYGRQSIWHKPRGFWVSVRGEDDWPTWCVNEEFNVESLAGRHEVKFKNSANLLILGTVAEILDFDKEFGASVIPGRDRRDYIDWERVVSGNSWDGIIIAPYQWPLRNSMKCFWYYSWDVASGCIWNLDAIESVTSARHVPLPLPYSYEDEVKKAEKL